MFSGLLALLFIAGINSTVFAADDPNNYRTYSFVQSIYSRYEPYPVEVLGPTNTLIVKPKSIEYTGGTFNTTVNAGYKLEGIFLYCGDYRWVTGNVINDTTATMPNTIITGYEVGWPIGIWPIQPMTEYQLEVRVYTGSNYRYGNSIYVYTPPANPTLIINNIEQTSVQLTIDPNGNPLYPNTCSAYLQRSSDLVNWNNVHDFTTSLTFTDNGLQAGKTYYYRVEIMGKQDPLRKKVYSYQGEKFYIEVQTTDDPAVVAAQKAENAAQLAQSAAQNASIDAQQAKEKATEAVDLIKALDTKFTNVQDKLQPAILSVKTTNGATATKSGSINIVATAINASQYRYRVNNGAFSEWQLLPVININSLSSGVNVIEVQATNSLEEDAPVSSGYMTVFRL